MDATLMADEENFMHGEATGVQTPPASTAAGRALTEAAARRAARVTTTPPKEINGRDGPDPVRYGDWEVKGLASDF